MKNGLRRTVAGLLIGLGVLAGSVQAAFVVDTKIGSADLGNSGQAGEEAALEGFAGVNLFFDSKFEQSTTGFNIQSNGAGSWYIDVAPDAPGYFILKFGTGGFNGVDSHYFFRNIAEFDKLVFTDAQVNNLTGGCGGNNCNSGRLSHYSLYNTDDLPPDELPEPSSVLLAAAALLGAGAVARRRRR